MFTAYRYTTEYFKNKLLYTHGRENIDNCNEGDQRHDGVRNQHAGSVVKFL